LYDTFTKKYGLISARANYSVFGSDSSYPLLGALEITDEDGNLVRKADMFTKRTIRPHTPITHCDTASEALAVSLQEKVKVDLPFMAQLTGMDEAALIAELDGLIFLDPVSDGWQTADEYLSGNVREKLKTAELSGNASNIRALQAVIPEDLDASEIAVRLGATWLPPEIVQQFMQNVSLCGTD
jgi:N12 class adenine-specific DNA methylase